MALINCPECGKQVSDSAPSCPHCGYVLTQQVDDEPEYVFPKKKRKKISSLGWAVIIIIIVLIIGFLKDCGGDSSDSNKTKYNGPEDAYLEAQSFVEKHLKSPSTADFPYYNRIKDNVKYLGTNKYKIDSYVDSQNSFGATIRTNFSCTIIFIGNGQVQCKDLVFDEWWFVGTNE